MELDDMVPLIVDLANKTSKMLTGDFAEIQFVIDNSDLVFAVWHDDGAADGVGVLVIKGVARLRDLAASGDGEREVKMRTSAIPCPSGNHAEALRQMVGEPVEH